MTKNVERLGGELVYVKKCLRIRGQDKTTNQGRTKKGAFKYAEQKTEEGVFKYAVGKDVQAHKKKKIKGGPENRSSRAWRPRLCSDGAGSYTGINDTYIVSIIHNSVNDTWTRLRLNAKASSVAAVCILPIYYVEPIINIIPTQIIMF